MSKAIFGTPRSLGNVDEIRIPDIRLHLREEDGLYEIAANFAEGEDIGGTFEIGEKGELRILESDLSPSDNIMLHNFIKILLKEYINSRGYSDITIN